MSIIAIVGRPNVGKSTLFNRIIGNQSAIVHDEPGVTRDRHYGEAEWAGRHFTLIDTGGYVPNSDDVFEKAIREQSQIAIEESDAVVFVVDGKEGVTLFDKEIAQILRRSNKKVVLAVNKIDSARSEHETAAFHSLGLGDPMSIAALGGRKIGDFLDVVTKDIVATSLEEKDERMHLAVIGKPNVGKSSFVNSIIGKDRSIVTPIAGTTRDPIDTILKHYGDDIVLIDTAGLMRKSRIKHNVDFYSTLRTLKSIDRCTVAIILFDATIPIEKQDLRIVETAVEKKKGVIIAINKWDAIEKETQTAIEYEKILRNRLRTYDFIPVIFISALTKQRIFKAIELAKEVHHVRNIRIPTSSLNDRILPEIERYPPSTKTGKDVKLNYVTQVRVQPPVFAFFANEPSMITDVYKRFLENRIRDHFGFQGVPLTLSFKRKNRPRET